ncbi:protoheme IX biogenesis protein HemY, partial [Xenorhabdus bovienii]|nr:protoheme IX biogenesis protein HemY [Xenorhabdus bovienii]
IRQQAYVGLMNKTIAEKGCAGLKVWWKDQSRKIRHDIVLQVSMAEHLIECNEHDTAQQIILDGLKQQYDERLLLLIPHLKANDTEAVQKT